ncbi:hypothetical protein [Gloeothece verrucosa]|uniref:Uncharacterized protein n=1 Tax=Gloeothece verrucosa (strain PCC 7822) TaxID=497965 RepID=E0UML2_GLOV7|nr:hypothetical protein [Gloeothece verrucosa]ADN18192.1 hypothetical protein Cyan7822_6408 [Gloeothece verrucosa PCC 7822]
MIAQVQKFQSELEVPFFDTLTQQDLDTKPITIKNSVAGYLFEGVNFSLGRIYNKTKPEQLRSFEGKTLEFANGDKFYFADRQVRNEIYPVDSDGAAYGSIPFTGCQNFHEVKGAKILIIDDQTGDNTIGLGKEAAKKLVGDCFGKIDYKLHALIDGKSYTPFQFRLGSRAQDNNPAARIAKGTLAPANLKKIGNGYDLIIPTSAFKGRKGDDNQAIKPGEYEITLGLGLKTHAYYGEHSLGPQVLVNYPLACAAFVEQAEQRLKELTQIVSDPIKLAHDYLEVTERRYRYQIENQTNFTEEFDGEELSSDEIDTMLDKAAAEENDEIVYNLLKADVEGHYQLLDHPKIVDALNKHLQNQYKEIATGRFIKFKGALLQPSLELKDNEFCDPNLPNGAEVIVTRSPFLNSNNFIALTNRYIPELMPYKGVAWMNPVAAANYLQGDFDGDRIAYALSNQDPQIAILAEEVKEKQLPSNRYADVIKKAKVPYQGSFEEIALSAKDNQIGLIANQVMKVIALEIETTMLPLNDQEKYLKTVNSHFNELIATDYSLPSELETLKPQIEANTKWRSALASFNSNSDLSEAKLTTLRKFLHEIVGLLGNELQVAVDGPKSALRPDQGILKAIKELTDYRTVGWLEDRKSEEVYRERPMNSNTYSPIDLLVGPVNEQFCKNSLEARPAHQFRNLFEDISYSEAQKKFIDRVRVEYNKRQSQAHQLKAELSKSLGPKINLHTRKGNILEVIDLLNGSNHPQTYSLDKMTIWVRENNNKKHPEKYMVLAQVPGQLNNYGKPLYKRIGYLSIDSERQYGHFIEDLIKKNKGSHADLGTLPVEILHSITPEQVSAAFKELKQYAEQIRFSIPDSEKVSYAAAMWDLCNARTNKENSFKKASAAFAIFAPEIQSRLSSLQFKSLEVSGIKSPSNQHQGRIFNQEKLPIEIGFEANPDDPNHNQRIILVDGKRLGRFAGESPQLPVGTKAQGWVSTPPGAGVSATLADGATIRIGVLKNYNHAMTSFGHDSRTLEIDFVKNPRGEVEPAVKLDGEILGRITDKQSQQILRRKGLLQKGTQLTATLDRDPPSIAKIEIDASTVEYPQVITPNKALVTPPKSLPTLLSRGIYQWEDIDGKVLDKDTLLLAVDSRKTEPTEGWFLKQGVPLTLDVSESEKSRISNYAIYKAQIELIPERTLSKLVSKFGQPRDAERFFEALLGKDIDNNNTKYSWSRYPQAGQATYEVSTQGDKRLSALVARLDDGRTIEEAYQLDVKGYRSSPTDKDWQKGKGKPPLLEKSTDQLWSEYKALWQQWVYENPHLMIELANTAKGKTLTDKFATSDISQARALAEILNENPQYTNTCPGIKPNDVNLLIPPSSKASVEQNRVKDRAMAASATQFIGHSAQSDKDVLSSTAKYQQCWEAFGLANTGEYTKDDVIMISGSGQERGVTDEQIKTTFEQHYKPLLEKAIAAEASFVVGNAAGTDKLVQGYLSEKGYKFEQTAQGYLKANSQQLNPQQAEYTKAIAPVVYAFLAVHDKTEIKGNHNDIKIEEDRLTMQNKNGKYKMIASYYGKDAQGKAIWQSESLPANSPGLTQDDVDLWKDPVILEIISQKIHVRQSRGR